MNPAPGNRRGRAAGLAPRRTCLGPRCEVIPGGSLRRLSRAVSAPLVWCPWTQSLTRPVSCTDRLSTGLSCSALGLFFLELTACRWGPRTLCPGGVHVCVCVCLCVCVQALLCQVGRAGLLGTFWCALPFPWISGCLLGLLGPRRTGAAPLLWGLRIFPPFCLPFPRCPFLFPVRFRLQPRVSGASARLC